MSEFRYTILLLVALGGCYAIGYNNGKNYYLNMINRILTSTENLKNKAEKKAANSESEDDGGNNDQINFKA